MYKPLNTTHLIKLCLFFCQSKILGRCLLLEIVHYVLAQFVLLNNTKNGKYFQAVCIITTITTMQLVSAKYEIFIDSLNTTFTLTLQTRSGLLFYFLFMFGKLVFQFTCESTRFFKVHINKSNRKAMNKNWSNQKANPALKTKTGNK